MAKQLSTEERIIVGQKIAAARVAKKLKQYQLAQKMGLHTCSLNMIECGKRLPGFVTLKRLWEVLNLKSEHLFGERE